MDTARQPGGRAGPAQAGGAAPFRPLRGHLPGACRACTEARHAPHLVSTHDGLGSPDFTVPHHASSRRSGTSRRPGAEGKNSSDDEPIRRKHDHAPGARLLGIPPSSPEVDPNGAGLRHAHGPAPLRGGAEPISKPPSEPSPGRTNADAISRSSIAPASAVPYKTRFVSTGRAATCVMHRRSMPLLSLT